MLPPSLNSAVSRRVHGSAGAFDVVLELSGTPIIDPRVNGTETLVFNFSANVLVAGGTPTAANWCCILMERKSSSNPKAGGSFFLKPINTFYPNKHHRFF